MQVHFSPTIPPYQKPIHQKKTHLKKPILKIHLTPRDQLAKARGVSWCWDPTRNPSSTPNQTSIAMTWHLIPTQVEIHLGGDSLRWLGMDGKAWVSVAGWLLACFWTKCKIDSIDSHFMKSSISHKILCLVLGVGVKK